MTTAEAIRRTLESPNVCDSNLECANVVDVINYAACSASRIANAITPRDAAAGKDATGGTIASLTEAVMGVTAGMVRIADAIGDLAEAVREHNNQ